MARRFTSGHLYALPLLLLVAACEDGSGVDKDKLVVDLTDAELEDLCSYVVETQGEPGVVTCDADDGSTFDVTLPTVDECIDDILTFSSTCDGTVDEFEQCARSVGKDACGDYSTCNIFFDCQ